MMTLARVLTLVLLLSVPAYADLLYTYTAPTFEMVTGTYTAADRVTGWFRLPDAYVVPCDSGCRSVDITKDAAPERRESEQILALCLNLPA